MNELISVIVPIYNVEKYLERCLDSIIKQTYKNLDIILVDDGSIDNSTKICDEYVKKDSRIKVIHKENGGLSDARNVGIDNSDGKYICFIDSDDYIELDMIENLYDGIVKNNANICCCGKLLEYEKNKLPINDGDDFCVDSKEALKKLLLKDEIDNSACDKLYEKDIFKDIRFPFGKYFEDIATIYKVVLASDKIAHIKYIGYHYMIRENSIVTEKFSEKQFDAIHFSKEMSDNIVKKYPELKEEANAFVLLEFMTTLRKIKRSENAGSFKKEYKKVKKEFNKNIFLLIGNKYIPVYKKIMAILIFFNLYTLVELLYKLISNKK